MMKFLKDPKRRHGRFALLLLLLFLAACVGLVSLMDTLEIKNGWRVDYSLNGVTTQSAATQAILNELTQPVHIYALFSKGQEDAPLMELLDRYDVGYVYVSSWERSSFALLKTIQLKTMITSPARVAPMERNVDSDCLSPVSGEMAEAMEP